MILIINGVIMVYSGLTFAFMGQRDRSWNGRLCVGGGWIWTVCGVFMIVCGIVQVVRTMI